MELKHVKLKVSRAIAVGLNRTFVELKHAAAEKANAAVEVLIEPLWN